MSWQAVSDDETVSAWNSRWSTEVTEAAPPVTAFTMTFSSAVSLDPVLTGGTGIVWTGPSLQTSTGTTPTPALDEAGLWTITADDLGAITNLNCINDFVTDLDLSALTGLTNLLASNNELVTLDLSCCPSLLDVRVSTNANLTSFSFPPLMTYMDVSLCALTSVDATGWTGALTYMNIFDNNLTQAALDVLVDAIDANRGNITGASFFFHGTNASVSAAAEAKILSMLGDGTASTWIRNYP